ncbi:testis-expressed protein 9 isoform X2 [Anolis sagrei]|uniref:testis-expressed protein 9 isoform X2 n=1 Tax=Anolis sagrei TaxID=38937 RepID=UPI00352017B2
MAAVKGGKKGLGLGLGLGAFLAKEEEYKRLNAALEAQAAELVRQAEEAMRDQQEALSRPLSTQLELLEEEAEAQRQRGLLSPGSSAPPPRQPLNKKKSSSAPAAGKERRPLPSAKPRPRHVPLAADDVAVPDFSLAKTIGRIEGQLEEGGGLPEGPEDLIPGGGSQLGAEAQIRFLKAKLRVMQEELDAMVQECGKKEDQNRELSLRLKEAEEERGRLQRAAMAQQSQAEKHKALAEDATRRSEALQQRLLGQEKFTSCSGLQHFLASEGSSPSAAIGAGGPEAGSEASLGRAEQHGGAPEPGPGGGREGQGGAEQDQAGQEGPGQPGAEKA